MLDTLQPGDVDYNYLDDLTPLDLSLVSNRVGRIEYVGGVCFGITVANWKHVQNVLREDGKGITGMFFDRPFFSLEAAEHLLDEAGDWNNDQAVDEGWAIFNLGDDLSTGIERLDEDNVFADDDFAMKFIAEQDTPYHRRALDIHHAADSLRFHLWGPEWVGSRIGPQP